MSDRKTEFITGIFQEWYGSLCRFLTQKLGCKENAMDVAQEAYVRMLCLEHPEEIRRPRAFLYKTASNLAVVPTKQCRFGNTALCCFVNT